MAGMVGFKVLSPVLHFVMVYFEIHIEASLGYQVKNEAVIVI